MTIDDLSAHAFPTAAELIAEADREMAEHDRRHPGRSGYPVKAGCLMEAIRRVCSERDALARRLARIEAAR